MTQNSLFDAVRAERANAHKPTGQDLRDRGIQESIDHAEQEHEGWSTQALDALRRFIELKTEPFMAEEVRLWAHNNGLPKPPSARAWGSIMLMAKRRGWIRFVGYGITNNPKCHCTPAGLWERNGL